MSETNCITCRVDGFKHDLCDESFCEKYHGDGDAEDFIKMMAQERKTGRWIPDGSELGIKCNKCGKSFSDYVNAGTGYMFLEETPNFCPNCGRKLRGEG